MVEAPVSDEEIGRLLDGELTASQRADIQARLAADPARAAEVFAEARRMEALRLAHARPLFAPQAHDDQAVNLQRALRRQWLFQSARLPIAACLLVALGWTAGLLTPAVFGTQPHQASSEHFVDAAREALRVAQLDASAEAAGEPQQQKIERLVGAINIALPPLPKTWRITNVQVQPWEGRQSLVVTAVSPILGPVTLVAAPMQDESAVPLTTATDGRTPTVHWQTGGTAYALMAPAEPATLEREAQQIEVATRRNLGPKVRG
ncbi:MAG: anti-sigma factor [Rhizobiaceae bacterium]